MIILTSLDRVNTGSSVVHLVWNLLGFFAGLPLAQFIIAWIMCNRKLNYGTAHQMACIHHLSAGENWARERVMVIDKGQPQDDKSGYKRSFWPKKRGRESADSFNIPIYSNSLKAWKSNRDKMEMEAAAGFSIDLRCCCCWGLEWIWLPMKA